MIRISKIGVNSSLNAKKKKKKKFQNRKDKWEKGIIE